MRQKALIVVPHQDDETNLAGNIIEVIMKQYDLYILYSSLDRDPERGRIRKIEATAACSVWNISEDHIAFLNYPDTPNKIGHHYYTDGDHRIVDDLKSWFLKLQPALILATDFDYHSDHRMLSLAFDDAMGQLLIEKTSFRPIVLKGFCYETAYYGVEDYLASCPGNCVPKIIPLSNPSFEWEKRISIGSTEKAGPIWSRKAYKALKAHKSQFAVLHAKSIVNQDNVYWERRTDNILNYAKLKSSANNVEKIRDFLILDTDDIITENPRRIDYSKACCRLEAGDWIKAEWDNQITFDRIIIHGSINDNYDVSVDIRIKADDKIIANVYNIRAFGRSTDVMIASTCAKSIALEVCSGTAIISEIEVFDGGGDFDCREKWLTPSNFKSKGSFINIVDVIGYTFVVIKTKVRRKKANLFLKNTENEVKEGYHG